MVVTAKITSKGQITLPKEVRKLLDVQTGSVVVFEQENDKVVIKPARTLQQFKGILKGRTKTVDFDQVREKVKEYRGKKVARGGRP
jgi:antitoxin PrlF